MSNIPRANTERPATGLSIPNTTSTQDGQAQSGMSTAPIIAQISSPLARDASPSSPGGTGIPDQKADADLPMTMAASVILTTLPGDAKEALQKATQLGPADTPMKVTIHFHPLRDAPALKPTRFKITSTQPFSAVVSFLRKKLRLKDADSVWCYVGNFCPSPDEGVAGLFTCFRTGDELKVGYSITPTFG